LNILKASLIRLRTLAEDAFLGRPEAVLFFGHGIGDDLLCTAVARELKKRGARKLVMFSRHPSLFEGNPDITAVCNLGYPVVGRRRFAEYRTIVPQFSSYDKEADRDFFRQEHVIVTMCRMAGVDGNVELRPWIFLTPDEREKGLLSPRQAVIQSAGLPAGPRAMKNKEWYPERFQEVVDQLRGEISFIQLGNREDPPLRGVTDLRGKTTLRESAAILSQSLVLVGQVGFLMHLARSVDCRSVIVYGGREDPMVSGYECNENIQGITSCAPCWLRNRCDFDRKCMEMISVDHVVEAVRRQVALHGIPLEVQTAVV